MLCLLLTALLAARVEPAKPALPAEWHGDWRGTLVVTGAADKPTEVPMALKVEPLKDGRGVTWAITYGQGEKATTRDYVLLPDGDRPGRFKLDEKNGVVLADRLVGKVLYSQFEVGGSLLTARYELRGDALLVEITSARPDAAKTGGGKVQGYTVEAVQTAVLKKK